LEGLMAETIIAEGDSAEQPTTAAESAHEAAVAEGATAVQTEQAAASAATATEAAEVALAAAQANMEAGAAVEGAVATANESAAVATVSAEMVHDALVAQTKAISALTEELQAQRRSLASDTKPKSKPAGDHPPAQKVPWYYRGGK
jgi:hypothetical protein